MARRTGVGTRMIQQSKANSTMHEINMPGVYFLNLPRLDFVDWRIDILALENMMSTHK